MRRVRGKSTSSRAPAGPSAQSPATLGRKPPPEPDVAQLSEELKAQVSLAKDRISDRYSKLMEGLAAKRKE
jgi:hypothetical protein